MRCFHHLRWVAADDGHTITRTVTISHGHALPAFGIWGLQPKKTGGGGEITEEECPFDFSAFSCFSSTLKSWFVGYSFFVRFMLFVRSSAGALWRYPGRGCKRFSFWFFIYLTSYFSLIVKSINWLFLYMIIRSQMLKFFCCLVFLLFPLFSSFSFFLTISSILAFYYINILQ